MRVRRRLLLAWPRNEPVGVHRQVEAGRAQGALRGAAALPRPVRAARPPQAGRGRSHGESFTFERGAAKLGGGDGWADVWKKGFFGWEYKGKHKDLDAAYEQLSSTARPSRTRRCSSSATSTASIIHTNFTNTPTEVHEIALDELGEPRQLEILRALFFDPEKLKPGRHQPGGHRGGRAAASARSPKRLRERGVAARRVAALPRPRRLLPVRRGRRACCPTELFRRVVEAARGEPERLATRLERALRGDGERRRLRRRRDPPLQRQPLRRRQALALTHDEVERAGPGRPSSTGARSTRRSSAPCSSAASTPTSARSSAPTTPAARTSRRWSSRW